MWSRLASVLLHSWEWPWTSNPPISTSHMVWITCMCQHAQFMQCWRQSLGLLCVLTTYRATSSAQAWSGKSSFLISYVLLVSFDVYVVQWADSLCSKPKNTTVSLSLFLMGGIGAKKQRIHLRDKNPICLSKHEERTIQLQETFSAIFLTRGYDLGLKALFVMHSAVHMIKVSLFFHNQTNLALKFW